MLEIFIFFSVSFIVAFLSIPVVILIAEKKKLYDIPDERKFHSHPIPSLGGVGIFLGFIFASLLGIKLTGNSEFQYFFAAAFVIFFIGLKDDIILLSATKKFIAQIIAAAIIIHLGGIRIESFYGIFGIGAIDPMYGIPLTYITIILIINAFNLIDGIDGLAGSLGSMVTILLGTYFSLVGLFEYSILSFTLAGSLIAFLIFNLPPAKIFMGDCGSLLLGMVSSILVLKFISIAGNPNTILHFTATVAMGISIIIIPLVDTIRVFSIRIFKGRSPFCPDRNHVHHLLVDRGISHATATLLCVTFNVILISLSYILGFLGNTVIIIMLFTICFIISGLLYYTLPKKQLVIHKRYILNLQNNTIRNRATSKVINLNAKENIPAEQLG